MNQRLSTSFFGLFCLIFLLFAHSSLAANTASTAPEKLSIEQQFIEATDCLNRSDIPCAKIIQLRIPAQTSYAKILDGAIAAAEQDADKAFRLLLPIQVSDAINDNTLATEAIASLHASLAQAYDQQGDIARSLEQRVLAERQWRNSSLANANQKSMQIKHHQQALWQRLATMERAQLVQLRGDSIDTTMQGWIDLALDLQNSKDTAKTTQTWRTVYPDHPADLPLILGLLPADKSVPEAANTSDPRKIALLLPFANHAFYPAADAIERGFMAAKNLNGDDADIAIYPTTGDKNTITSIYERAVSEGADFVVGPLVRDEITALATGKLSVPTLALNQAESNLALQHLYSLGLSVDTEAAQIARMARDVGMQTAIVIAGEQGISPRLAKAFEEAWLAEGGAIVMQINIQQMTTPEELQSSLQGSMADLIVLATDPELARAMRAHLDITIPTYGFSHIYTGVNYEPDDAALMAVRFLDLPWILNPDQASFNTYREAAASLPEGMMQRWFALGVDAYQVISTLKQPTNSGKPIKGLTGRIEIGADGQIKRTLAVGRFTGDGVAMEYAP